MKIFINCIDAHGNLVKIVKRTVSVSFINHLTCIVRSMIKIIFSDVFFSEP